MEICKHIACFKPNTSIFWLLLKKVVFSPGSILTWKKTSFFHVRILTPVGNSQTCYFLLCQSFVGTCTTSFSATCNTCDGRGRAPCDCSGTSLLLLDETVLMFAPLVPPNLMEVTLGEAKKSVIFFSCSSMIIGF